MNPGHDDRDAPAYPLYGTPCAVCGHPARGWTPDYYVDHGAWGCVLGAGDAHPHVRLAHRAVTERHVA